MKKNIDNGTPIVSTNTLGTDSRLTEMKFKLDDHLRDEIISTKSEYEKSSDDVLIHNLELGNCPTFRNKFWTFDDKEEKQATNLSRKWMKSVKFSPDAFQQIGFAIAAAIIKGNQS